MARPNCGIMDKDLLQRLTSFAEECRPEWQIVLASYGPDDLVLTLQDLKEILKLAAAQQKQRGGNHEPTY